MIKFFSLGAFYEILINSRVIISDWSWIEIIEANILLILHYWEFVIPWLLIHLNFYLFFAFLSLLPIWFQSFDLISLWWKVLSILCSKDVNVLIIVVCFYHLLNIVFLLVLNLEYWSRIAWKVRIWLLNWIHINWAKFMNLTHNLISIFALSNCLEIHWYWVLLLSLFTLVLLLDAFFVHGLF